MSKRKGDAKAAAESATDEKQKKKQPQARVDSAPPVELGGMLIMSFHPDLSVKRTWDPVADTTQEYKVGVMVSPSGYVCGKRDSHLATKAAEALTARKAAAADKRKQPAAKKAKAAAE